MNVVREDLWHGLFFKLVLMFLKRFECFPKKTLVDEFNEDLEFLLFIASSRNLILQNERIRKNSQLISKGTDLFKT